MARERASSEQPKREGPLLELLRKRASLERNDLRSQAEKINQITLPFKQPCSFVKMAAVVENEIFDAEGDIELATDLLAHFSFLDRPAIEFALRLLFHERLDFVAMVQSLKTMLKHMSGEPSSVISHQAYLALLHTLLKRVGEH